MELKCSMASTFVATIIGFNCTFMELKYDEQRTLSVSLKALIVPLWN